MPGCAGGAPASGANGRSNTQPPGTISYGQGGAGAQQQQKQSEQQQGDGKPTRRVRAGFQQYQPKRRGDEDG